MKIKQVKIDVIHEAHLRPRFGLGGEELDELRESMATFGLIQPIVLVEDGDGYRLVVGRRRLEAARQLGWPTISAVVRTLDGDAEASVTIHENLKRLDLNPVEEATMMAQVLAERGWTHEQLSEVMGKSRVWVTRTLGLLDLDDDSLRSVIDKRLSVAASLELRRLEDPPVRAYYRELAERHGVTVPVLRTWVDERLSRPTPPEEWHPAAENGWEPPPPEEIVLSCGVCDRTQDEVLLQIMWICRQCAYRLEVARQGGD